LWGRLVAGRLYKDSGQTKQGCRTPSFAKAHTIKPEIPDQSTASQILQIKVWLLGIGRVTQNPS
jgi:hypothetical protein